MKIIEWLLALPVLIAGSLLLFIIFLPRLRKTSKVDSSKSKNKHEDLHLEDLSVIKNRPVDKPASSEFILEDNKVHEEIEEGSDDDDEDDPDDGEDDADDEDELMTTKEIIQSLEGKSSEEVIEIVTSEYEDIRNPYDSDDANTKIYSFENIASILAKAGLSAKKILEIEEEYFPFDLNDENHRRSIFEALRPCGFNNIEILSAIEPSGVTDSTSDIVLIALESKVDKKDLVGFLKSENWDKNPEDLLEELNAEDDIEFQDKIDIIYRLMHPEIFS